ncbi:MAG: hypothetical protein WAM98_11510 [Terriglobales bacterium]
MFFLRLLEPKFVFESQSNTLDFCLEPEPDVLLIFLVFFEEQAERFLGGKLGNTGEILNTEAIQNLSSL